MVVGGHVGPVGGWLGARVEQELARRVLAAAGGGWEIRACALGEDAAARGAAAGVLRDVMADPGALGSQPAHGAADLRYPALVDR